MPREIRTTRDFELSTKDMFDLLNGGMDADEEHFDPLTHTITEAHVKPDGTVFVTVEHLGAVEPTVVSTPSPPEDDEQES